MESAEGPEGGAAVESGNAGMRGRRRPMHQGSATIEEGGPHGDEPSGQCGVAVPQAASPVPLSGRCRDGVGRG
eukprot:1263144-Prymnesium_polylepis.1